MVFFCRSSFFSMRQDTPHYIETSLDHLLFSLDLFSYEANAAIQDTLDLLWPFTFLPPLDLVCDKCCKQKHTSIYLGLPPLDLFWGQCRKQDLIWWFPFLTLLLVWGNSWKTRHSRYSDLAYSFKYLPYIIMRQVLQNKTFLLLSRPAFRLPFSFLFSYYDAIDANKTLPFI